MLAPLPTGCVVVRLTCSAPPNLAPKTPTRLSIRPEDIRIGVADLTGPNTAPAHVEESEFLGSFYRLRLRHDGLEDTACLTAEVSKERMRDLNIQKGDELAVHLPPSLIHIYPVERM